MVKAGLDRLHALQNPDGGWGWFDKDKSDPFMTACAVGGLLEAKRLGHTVDAVRLEEGVSALRGLANGEQDLNRLAYICLALSRSETPGPLDRLLTSQAQLGPYALAATATSLQRARRPEAAEIRRRLLEKRAGDHWESPDWHAKWENVAIETTALAIAALSEADPANGAIAPAVEWMLAQRSGNRWRSTKDTATAIHAILTHVVATNGKLDALARVVDSKARMAGAPALHRKVRLTLNGETREILVDLNDPSAARFECHFEGRYLNPGDNLISADSTDGFEFEIEGQLRTTGGAARPPTHFTIATSADRPLDRLRLGDEIVVTARVEANDAYEFVMVEVPVPAGCEIIRGSGDGEFSRFEARHDQAIFYVRSAGKPLTWLRFRMRCGFVGSFKTLPPAASVMYDENLAGVGKGSLARIE